MSGLWERIVEIRGTLTVVTPLHVGSGELEPDDALAVVEQDGKKGHPQSARVQRDHRELPYLPGSGVKGALRALAASAGDAAAVAALFGEIKDAEDLGVMGALIIYGCEFQAPPTASALPKYKEKKRGKSEGDPEVARGLGLSARAKRDAARGTAEDKKLFHAEVVAPGTTFSFRARYFPKVSGDFDTQTEALLGRLLATAMSQEGVSLGRGTGDGDGRVSLSAVTCIEHRRGVADKPVAWQAPPGASPVRPASERFNLTLTCTGPFFVSDWSYERPKTQHQPGAARGAAEAENTAPHLKAQAQPEDAQRPWLPGTSVMGALRARTDWLLRLKQDEEREEIIEYLFGSERCKGALVVDALDCTEPGTEVQPTSVRIDRFSAAPVDGGLFGIDCFFGPRFEASLRLDARRGEQTASRYEAKQALFEKAWNFVRIDLGKDLKDNGLKLGHSSNRGFGWFEVEWLGLRGSENGADS